MSTIVEQLQGGFDEWPELLPTLGGMLESQAAQEQVGALRVLAMLCEDLQDRFQETHLEALVPRLLAFFKSPHARVRRFALECLAPFTARPTRVFMSHSATYLEGLFHLAGDGDAAVRKKVAHAFNVLMERSSEVIEPHFPRVVEVILTACDDADEDVAMEACDFWNTVCSAQAARSLETYLPRIVPTLVRHLVYSADELAAIEAEGDDPAEAERQQDLKRTNLKGGHRGKGAGGKGGESDDEDEDESDSDDGDFDDDNHTAWSLRKCAGVALDLLSHVFQNDILPHLLPLLDTPLNNPTKWEHREAAILAIGAVAEGGYRGMRQYLPDMIPFLVTFIGAEHPPLVRSIACWAVGRYSAWIVRQRDSADKFLQPVLAAMLTAMVDMRSKRVQEAACAAFTVLEEDAGPALSPFLPDIVNQFVAALEMYQTNNTLLLLDTIATLAHTLKDDINNEAVVNRLLPAILNRFEQSTASDPLMVPLMEALTPLCVSLGPTGGMEPFARRVFDGSLRLIEMRLTEDRLAKERDLDPPDMDIVFYALDLLAGLCEGLGTSFESLFTSAPQLWHMLIYCMKDPTPDVRQSAYGLVGELSKAAFAHLAPHVGDLMTELDSAIEPKSDYPLVTNNAVWASAEIAFRLGPGGAATYAPRLLSHVSDILKTTRQSSTLIETTCIAVGRLAMVEPAIVAQAVRELGFFEHWAMGAKLVRQKGDLEMTLFSLCRIMEAEPERCVPGFSAFCLTIGSYSKPSRELHEAIYKILHGFKPAFGAGWADYIAKFPDHLRQKLHERYELS